MSNCMRGKEGGLRLARGALASCPASGGCQERTRLEGRQRVECLVPRDSQVEETRRWSDIQAWSSREASQEFTNEGLNLL